MPGAIVVLVGFALIAAGCGTSSDDTEGDAIETDAVPLECEIERYPCSLTEVPIEILERSDSLSDEVLDMFGGGASTEAVDTWLNEQEGMVEVESDDDAVRFRLDGGRGTWILRSSSFGSRSAPAAGSSIDPPSRMASASLHHVVGPESKDKQALVLSPFLWDFGSSDDGGLVAGILSGTKGYEGGVQFAFNETANSTAVNVGSFTGWTGFDVIHVVSHGTRLCKKTPCRAAIAATALVGDAPQGQGVEIRELIAPLNQRGLELAKGEGKTRGFDLAIPIVLLTADFFRAEYEGGLKDALIFFNACEIFGDQATDLGDAIRGESSVFFGWSEIVDSDAARAAAELLYTELSEGGYPAEVAFERVGALRIDGRLGGQLKMGERSGNEDLRIRDVVELLDPVTGELLSSASEVDIIGEVADGEPDDVPFSVRIDGMTAEGAPASTLHLSVNGEAIDPIPVSDGEVNDKDQWLLTGVATLGFDLEEDTEVTFEARVELHSGGESKDETPALAVGGPIMGRVWHMDATTVVADAAGGLVASATLTLEFEEGQDNGEPHPRYVVTGGTVTRPPRSGDPGLGCTFSGPGATFEVTPAMSPANPSGNSAPSVLIFDTTVMPVEYRGVIYTNGPDDQVVQDCSGIGDGYGSNTISYGGSNTWMLVEGEDHLTVTDRRTIDAAIEYAAGYTMTFTITRQPAATTAKGTEE